MMVVIDETGVYDGCGFVLDGEPEREYVESVQKMAAQFEAIEMAERRVRAGEHETSGGSVLSR